jgi:hypothetical protein
MMSKLKGEWSLKEVVYVVVERNTCSAGTREKRKTLPADSPPPLFSRSFGPQTEDGHTLSSYFTIHYVYSAYRPR